MKRCVILDSRNGTCLFLLGCGFSVGGGGGWMWSLRRFTCVGGWVVVAPHPLPHTPTNPARTMIHDSPRPPKTHQQLAARRAARRGGGGGRGRLLLVPAELVQAAPELHQRGVDPARLALQLAVVRVFGEGVGVDVEGWMDPSVKAQTTKALCISHTQTDPPTHLSCQLPARWLRSDPARSTIQSVPTASCGARCACTCAWMGP